MSFTSDLDSYQGMPSEIPLSPKLIRLLAAERGLPRSCSTARTRASGLLVPRNPPMPGRNRCTRVGHQCVSASRATYPYVQALLPLRQQSSTCGCSTRTKVPLGVTPVTSASNRLANPVAHGNRRQSFRHLALDFSGGVSFRGALAGNAGQLIIGIRSGLMGKHRLDHLWVTISGNPGSARWSACNPARPGQNVPALDLRDAPEHIRPDQSA